MKSCAFHIFILSRFASRLVVSMYTLSKVHKGLFVCSGPLVVMMVASH